MAQRQNMRVHVKPPKIEWRTIAITDIDPAHFAQSLQTALQELSDTGFNILAQLTRGSAHVIPVSYTHLEEMGEVAAAVGKTLRWGLGSANPELPLEKREMNGDWILRELHDLQLAINLAHDALCIEMEAIDGNERA